MKKSFLFILFFTTFVFAESFDLIQELPEGISPKIISADQKLPVITGKSSADAGGASAGGSLQTPVFRVDKNALRHRTAFIDAHSVLKLAEKYSQTDQASEENNFENNNLLEQEPLNLLVSVFPYEEFSVQVESVKPTQFGGFFFSGKLSGGSGFMTMSLSKDGSIRASVHSAEGVFNISGDRLKNSKNPVLIQEIDMSRVRRGNDARYISPKSFSPSMAERLAAPVSRNNSGDRNEIDLLVLYTTAAKNAQSGASSADKKRAIETTIQNEITKANEALKNSGVSAGLSTARTINLAGIAEVNYTQSAADTDCDTDDDPDGIDCDLEKLFYKPGVSYPGLKNGMAVEIDPDGKLDDVHKLREKYGADLVHLFVKDSNTGTDDDGNTVHTCGVAYTWGSLSTSSLNRLRYAQNVYNKLKEIGHDWLQVLPSTVGGGASTNSLLYNSWIEELGFSVSAVNESVCTADYTFAHEIGHNLGLHHDSYTEYPDPSALNRNNVSYPLYPYAYGYTGLAQSGGRCFGTIMAYDSYCEGRSLSYIVTPYFSHSHKDITSSGQNLGKPGQTGRDAFRVNHSSVKIIT